MLWSMLWTRGGKTHAINKKTRRTYCGKTVSGSSWKPLDVVPSSENLPTCKICSKLFLFEKDSILYEKLNSAANDLKRSMIAFLSSKVLLRDVEGLARFTTVVKYFLASEKTRVQIEKAKPPGTVLWLKIISDEELALLELKGFVRGEEKGKTMEVPLETVAKSLEKQYKDFKRAYGAYRALLCSGTWSGKYFDAVKRTVGDLRNAAGCVFLKLKEESQC